ncbi:MAG TPA: hypothetical protein VFI02_01155 [Armatimonadota bacterium]|nr:hypothetical protein [Armatimonadota bacterium]
MDRAHLQVESGLAQAEPILAWKVHLVRENPAKVLLIAPVLVISLLVCYIFTHSLVFMAVTFALLASSLADYLFPVRYEINERGASSRTLLRRTFVEWDRVRKYYLDDHGIKLSTLPRPGRLEAYRGLYLRFGGNRDEVIEAVRRMRDAVRAKDG